MSFQRDSENVLGIDMTPVVDAMFTLILFLVVTSTYVDSMEQDVNINLPSMSHKLKEKKPKAKPIYVNVRFLPGGNAYYHVDNEKMTLTTLTINLARARARDKDQSVVIRGDRDVKWDHVAKVMGCCAHAGITKVATSLEVSE